MLRRAAPLLVFLAGQVASVASIATSSRVSGTPTSPGLSPSPARVLAARELLIGTLAAKYESVAARKKSVTEAVDWLLGSHTAAYETRGFVEAALRGEWALEESSGRRGSEAESLERDLVVESITQTLDLGRGRDSLVNTISWRRPLTGETGTFRSACDVEMNASEGRLATWTLSFPRPTKHSIHPKAKLVSDVVDVVDSIARVAPFELFDPHGTLLDLEFVDPDLRVMGVARGSSRGTNNLHVYRRSIAPP